ncbi:cell wall metabolism sensor histidine kinase WalK [Oceanobacillus caeni]|uniref:ATP-binding protein n=1 Tax=Bacillaceae TaxID=186817 RepID=UPI000622A258|nr:MULTISPECIES: ATP-binding protein [Bacillaceae]KKE79316.1 histidine kinase [Bacilli bacterium VT-13-104]MBU8789757.1 cell wall metabolism sensor histidine kinase WalK [Oceanobacillus caeni]MCR1834372.1 cell wall metabolism sensor histidine kinase WalK [Oceanobacillus caeni]
MFWRSVVGKLAITILLLVCFVLFILSIFLLQFFENFHLDEAETSMMKTATKISYLVDEQEDHSVIQETVDLIKDPTNRVAIIFPDGDFWVSESNDNHLFKLEEDWIKNDPELVEVMTESKELKKQITLPNSDMDAIIVGKPVLNNGGVFVYQSLQAVEQTKLETRKIIYLAAGIALVLTTFFAVFLSTRITSPLIKMREAAHELTRGEFNTKVPILTHDEIGDLAIEFNRMGRQLKFHINALRQEKEQFSSIVTSMADGVVTLNRNGDMIVINPPAEKFLENWYFEHNVSTNLSNKPLPVELKEVLEEVIGGEDKVLREIVIQGRNYVMLMTPLYDGSQVRGAVAVIRDMTEERRLDKLRKDFIANVSHELRTPISMLQGYSEAIVDDIAESKEEKNELAKIIQDESLRMGRLVNELLDLARMEAGHIQLNKEEVEIQAFVERILKKFQGIAADNQVELLFENHIKSNTAILDPDRVEQIFTNLIDNAIRHTDENGFVKVSVKNNENELVVSIEDNGSGIPEEDLPFVFERFYKADKSRTRNKQKKGTGLGLAIAKNIVNAHNGSISVKSKLHQGTTFTFNIPRDKQFFI